MVRRQPARDPGQITFVHSSEGQNSPEARKLARSHASYWSHKGKKKSQPDSIVPALRPHAPTKRRKTHPGCDYNASSASTTDAAERRLCKIAGAGGSDASLNIQFGSGHDAFSCLPQVLAGAAQQARIDLLPISTLMPDFFGESFLRNTILRSGEICQSRYAAALLLCYAYHMAMTGSGSYSTFMWLRGRVIQLIIGAVSDIQNAPTLDTIMPVMALGTPLVCELIPAQRETALREDSSSSPESSTSDRSYSEANVTEYSSTEYDMHYSAVTKLLRMSRDPAYLRSPDGSFVFLVKVISSAHRFLTFSPVAPDTWAVLFRKFELYYTNRQPETCWHSPLFGSSTALRLRPSTSELERRCLDLAASARDWFREYKRMRQDLPNNLDRARDLLEEELSKLSDVERCLYGKSAWAMYEACFLCAQLMKLAADMGCSLALAASFDPSTRRLPAILQSSDLSHLWGDACGLLYWVTLICHVASVGGDGRRISTVVLAHFTQRFAASEIPLSAALVPIKEILAFLT